MSHSVKDACTVAAMPVTAAAWIRRRDEDQ
jgi:hypothetical protein